MTNKPFACPVCNGAGTVSRPPWIAGDQRSWTSTAINQYPCTACNGTGVVWGKEEYDIGILPNPPTFIPDEPLPNFDIPNIDEIQKSIKEVRKETLDKCPFCKRKYPKKKGKKRG